MLVFHINGEAVAGGAGWWPGTMWWLWGCQWRNDSEEAAAVVKDRGRSNIEDHNISYIDTPYNLNHRFLRCMMHLAKLGALEPSPFHIRSHISHVYVSNFF